MLAFFAALAGAAAPSPEELAAFHHVAVEHAKIRACFLTKLTVGMCTRGSGADAASVPPEVLVAKIGRRLQWLSREGPKTAALIYHQDAADGLLDAYLLDSAGWRAHGSTPRVDLQALQHGLQVSLDVVSRAAARAPRSARALETVAEPAREVALDELTATLLPDPVRRALVAGGYQRVVVLPWGPIGSLPLSALRLGPEALVDRASVVVVPDLEALTLPLQRLPGPSDAERLLQEMYAFDAAMLQSGPRVVVGDPAFPQGGAWSFPPLPGARREAVAVAARLGTTALVGEAATHQAVSAALDRAVDRPGILYFATHGVSDGVNPMTESFLALADEPLLADEIRRRRHFGRHPLVVLSACQTGLGKVFDGGLFGISRAFYGAGAGQVVGSLWSVDDEATYRLMTTFVDRLKEGATAPEEALRQAMIEARTANPDPATWASFVVFGNPSG